MLIEYIIILSNTHTIICVTHKEYPAAVEIDTSNFYKFLSPLQQNTRWTVYKQSLKFKNTYIIYFSKSRKSDRFIVKIFFLTGMSVLGKSLYMVYV